MRSTHMETFDQFPFEVMYKYALYIEYINHFQFNYKRILN